MHGLTNQLMNDDAIILHKIVGTLEEMIKDLEEYDHFRMEPRLKEIIVEQLQETLPRVKRLIKQVDPIIK